MKYKLLRFSLLSLLVMLCGNVFADEVTMQYTGSTTTNMTGENDAALLGLDATKWNVIGYKGSSSNLPGLNKAGDIRLYYAADGGSTITVQCLSGAIINNIAITYTGDDYSNAYVAVNGEKVEGKDGAYAISSRAFVIGNANTSNIQVRIKKIVINYGTSSDTRTATTMTLSGDYPTSGEVGEKLELPSPIIKAGETTLSVDYSWESSDESVAVYDNGKVLLKKVGTTTMKASYAGDATYQPCSASYTLTVKEYTTYTSIADMLENITSTKTNIKFAFTGLSVTYVNGLYTYVHKNGDGDILLYGANLGLEKECIYNGSLVGQLYTYNGLPEIAIASATDIQAEKQDGMVMVSTTIITLDQLPYYINKMCAIEHAEYVSANKKNLTFKVGDTEFTAYNNFGLSTDELTAGKKYAIEGFGAVYSKGESNTYQIYPTKFTEEQEEAPAEFQDFEITNEQLSGELDASTLPACATFSGTKRGDSHGYGNVTITVAVNGPVKFTIGGCQYANPAICKVTNAAGELLAELNLKTATCYHQDGAAATYEYTGEPTTLTFSDIAYLPYFKAEAFEPVPEPVAFQDFEITNEQMSGEFDASTLPNGVTFSGTKRGDSHGYGNVTITVPVTGKVTFTIGGCQYANPAICKVTNAAGELLAELNLKTATCYHQDGAAVTYIYKGEPTTLTFSDIAYLPYFKAEGEKEKEKVTLDNEPATANFAFNEGTEGQTATFSNADYFLNSKVSHGTGVILEGKDNKGYNQTWFNVAAKDSKANEGNAIRFLITPKPGFSFTPTKVSFKTTRYGTNGGKLDIAWQNIDGTTVSLASGILPNRDNGEKPANADEAGKTFSELVYNVTGATPGEGACGLKINLYSLDPGKHVGFSDIIIEGTLSGTEKELPILASFKINNKEYAVDDVFGDEYEATLKLSKTEAMVSAENPLTDVTATSGEIGTITYEGTDTSCKVTIPMTAGETQMDYVLNIIQKPDYKLSYIAVDGTTVLTEQTVEEDGTIGEFAYNIADVAASKDGYKARGWFKQNYLGEKFATTDVIKGNANLYALETEIEMPSESRKYVFDLTNQFFYAEDHEGFNSIGSGYWHDKQHGWAFNNGDQIELLVGPKATINFSLCQYSKAGATIEGSNGASISAVAESDGGAGSFDYEGEGGTLTLTINSQGAVYIHSITVFNTSETNYTKKGDWIIVKKGDASSLLDAIEVAKGIENAKIFLPNGTYDLGETVKTTISGKNVSLIGQSAENTIIVNRPPAALEGLDKADLLKNTCEGLYMQDISLKNDLSYGGNDGRAASLHDQGTKTVCKNVFLLSHQDTYYSHKVGGLYYWEGGELHGTVDYLCGNGKAYFNEVKLVNEQRNSATITANSELYVFNNCTVENNATTYNFGRAWSDNPVCVFLNTTLLDPNKLVSSRWNLTGINCDYSVAGEYGTKDANGNNITPESNVVTFTKQNTTMNTILDATALDTYSIQNVLGDWGIQAQEQTRQLDAAAQNAKYENGTVTFTLTYNGMTGCALFKNGEFVDISGDGTFSNVSIDPATDVLTIRTANMRGGFGPEAVIDTKPTGIKELSNDNATQPKTIYNMQGIRVQKAQKGLYIIDGKKVVVK